MVTTCSKPTLIVITGPTASGKTSTAIELAKILKCEIISADSRQFYKEMKIGTAVPSEQELTTIKHHFVGNLSIIDSYNISKYEEEVLGILPILFEKSNYAILCGGSGLYIDAVVNGVDYFPDPDPDIRRELKNIVKENGMNELNTRLKEIDPEYYSVVDLHNPTRVVRALEIFYSTGLKYSELRTGQSKSRDFNVIKFCLQVDRDILYNNINLRVDQMITDGLLNEAEGLYQYKKLTALKTVGYREIFDYIDGIYTLNEAIEKIKTNSRRYAKRQITWFKRDKEYVYVSQPGAAEKMYEILKNN